MRLRHLEAGQGIQDGAIQDLGDVVSGNGRSTGRKPLTLRKREKNNGKILCQQNQKTVE